MNPRDEILMIHYCLKPFSNCGWMAVFSWHRALRTRTNINLQTNDWKVMHQHGRVTQFTIEVLQAALEQSIICPPGSWAIRSQAWHRFIRRCRTNWRNFLPRFTKLCLASLKVLCVESEIWIVPLLIGALQSMRSKQLSPFPQLALRVSELWEVKSGFAKRCYFILRRLFSFCKSHVFEGINL